MLSGNNEEYIDLVFERIDNASVLSNFYCGIPDMDDFIHAKLQGYLTELGAKLMSSSKRIKLLPLIHAKELYQLTCPS